MELIYINWFNGVCAVEWMDRHHWKPKRNHLRSTTLSQGSFQDSLRDFCRKLNSTNNPKAHTWYTPTATHYTHRRNEIIWRQAGRGGEHKGNGFKRHQLPPRDKSLKVSPIYNNWRQIPLLSKLKLTKHFLLLLVFLTPARHTHNSSWLDFWQWTFQFLTRKD